MASPGEPDGSDDAGGDRRITVARHGDVELIVPSAYALMVGFHQGGTTGLDLEIVAPLAADHAASGDGPDVASAGGDALTVIVLPRRERATDPTTAMDVVVPRERPIVAPVDGTVTAVEDYRLYGRIPDVRVTIAPAGGPDLEVVVLHLEDPRVAPGDAVRAGGTVIAGSARVLPETSQIDRYTRRSVREEAPPHVHVEVRAR